jgi:hypothetical protein
MAFGNVPQPGSEWERVAIVIGRSLAFLCLQSTPAKEGTLLQKADFLGGLGLKYADAAQMLGTSEASLKELARQSKKPKGGDRGKRRKKSR